MMKMKKKIIFGTTALALVGAVTTVTLMAGFTAGGTENTATQVRASALEKGDLAISVNVTGTVYSAKSTSVYSDMSYPVKTVLVSVGDKVAVGDALAELDLSDLEEEIAQKEASLSSSQASAWQSYQTAQNDLATYKRNLENGNDEGMINARASVDSAEAEIVNAELDVESAETEVDSAYSNLSSARSKLRDYDDDISDLDEDEDTGDDELDSLRDQYRSARTSLEKAQTSLEKSKANLEKAVQNLEKAQASYEAATVSSADTAVSYESKVQSAALNTNFSEQQLSIESLKAELSNSSILSPVSGTVTEVYAVEGASGNGLLFIIQDTNDLKVVANIKEYDIGTVAAGDRAIIQTDATGDAEISGTLAKIAPTSTLTSTGDMSDSSTEAEYQSEITVSSSGSKEGLKIGMNAQVSIITEEHKDVFSVLYDAVVKTPEGSFIYIMEPEGGETAAQAGSPARTENAEIAETPEVSALSEGSDRPSAQRESGEDREMPGFTAKAVAVTTGIENDLYIEVSGEGLTEGMMVISDATGITEGMSVTPRVSGGTGTAEGGAPAGDGGFGMPGMGGGPRMGG